MTITAPQYTTLERVKTDSSNQDFDAYLQKVAQRGEEQMKKGQYMEFDEFERRIKAIPLKK